MKRKIALKVRAVLLWTSITMLGACGLPQVNLNEGTVVPYDPLQPQEVKFAFFSPDDSHLLTLTCRFGFCRPWRYYFKDQRWEEVLLKGYDGNWEVSSVNYSPDGRKILMAAIRCNWVGPRALCPYFDSRLLVADSVSGDVVKLAGDRPSFAATFDAKGEKILYWGLTNVTAAGSGRAYYASHNVFMRNVSGADDEQIFKYVAQIPLAPLRISADSQLLTIAAEDIVSLSLEPPGQNALGQLIVVANLSSKTTGRLGPVQVNRGSFAYGFVGKSQKIIGLTSKGIAILDPNDADSAVVLSKPGLHGAAIVSHAAVSQSGEQYVFVQAGHLYIDSMKAPGKPTQIIRPPAGVKPAIGLK